MDRDQPRLGRHLGPVADAADVACVAQGDGREAVLAALVDADADGLRRHGLAEAVLAVDHGDHRRVDDDVDGDVGQHRAVLLLGGVARHADDAVAVVARQVGAHRVAADAPALLRRAPRRGEDIRDESSQRFALMVTVILYSPLGLPPAWPAPGVTGMKPRGAPAVRKITSWPSPSSRPPRAAGRRRSRGSRSG